ncbi:Orn/Lys/Arg family decarboxylase [Streptomyces scabiei]
MRGDGSMSPAMSGGSTPRPSGNPAAARRSGQPRNRQPGQSCSDTSQASTRAFAPATLRRSVRAGGVWQPDEVTDPASGTRLPFDEAPADLLQTEASCWHLASDADWHGFPGLAAGYCMLDPIKVTLTCPGLDATGVMSEWGIPARILTAYLTTRGIVVEKTDSYTTLVLFSMGITKGKWGTLLDALMDFKDLYDGDAPLDRVLPALVAEHPRRYTGRSLRDLCQEMHDHLRDACLVELLDRAFQQLPEPVAPPQLCYERLIRGGTERIRLGDAPGRIAAAMVTVTPPGIPVLMPGESIGEEEGPLLRYLSALESFDRHFPGFGSETHGVTRCPDTGDYLIECLRPDEQEEPGAITPAQRRRTQSAKTMG